MLLIDGGALLLLLALTSGSLGTFKVCSSLFDGAVEGGGGGGGTPTSKIELILLGNFTVDLLLLPPLFAIKLGFLGAPIVGGGGAKLV